MFNFFNRSRGNAESEGNVGASPNLPDDIVVLKKWEIPHMSKIGRVESSTFFVAAEGMLTSLWFLEVAVDSAKDNLSVSLVLDQSQVGCFEEAVVELSCFLNAADGTRTHSSSTGMFSTLKPGEAHVFDNLPKPSYLQSSNTVDDDLRLELEFRYRRERGNDSCQAGQQMLIQMFLNEDLKDLVIVADDGGEMTAHCAVLAAKSSTFRLIFGNEVMFGRRILSIKNANSIAISMMLQHIYVGLNPPDNTPTLMVVQMLALADHFGLLEMKSWSEGVLIEKLDVETASDMLTLGNRFQLLALRKLSSEVIENNIAQVMTTDSWARLTAGVENESAETLSFMIKISTEFVPIESVTVTEDKIENDEGSDNEGSDKTSDDDREGGHKRRRM